MQSISGHKIHPVANLFPLINGSEFSTLVDDIKTNGLQESIWRYEGKVIDGRNRLRACAEIGIQPRFREWNGSGSLVSFVISMNLHRRHLDSSQRAAVSIDAVVELEREAKERQREGGRQGGKLAGRGRPSDRGNQRIDEAYPQAAEQAAKLLNTNRQYVSDAKRFKAEAPELFERIKSGELTIPAAKREIKRAVIMAPRHDEQCCTVDDLQSLVAKEMKFGCIYADPPWQYGNQGTRAATDNHYSTMTIEEIVALPIPELAADECHLHLWTTNGFLRDALGLLDKWGFEFKSTFVWVKPQLGIGNYWRCSHEIMLLGVRGGLTFPPTNYKSWIEFDRTEHSAKPEKVRGLIETVSPAPRLELFGRVAAPGWWVWGNQIRKTLFDPEMRKIG